MVRVGEASHQGSMCVSATVVVAQPWPERIAIGVASSGMVLYGICATGTSIGWSPQRRKRWGMGMRFLRVLAALVISVSLVLGCSSPGSGPGTVSQYKADWNAYIGANNAVRAVIHREFVGKIASEMAGDTKALADLATATERAVAMGRALAAIPLSPDPDIQQAQSACNDTIAAAEELHFATLAMDTSAVNGDPNALTRNVDAIARLTDNAMALNAVAIQKLGTIN